jgi:hypothetical protein
VKELENGIFTKHEDFLSNPLLLTIMLLTFTDVAEIPTKMHIFYEHAFDALFFRHDSSKGLFRRETCSKLAIDDFKDILSIFSTSGYLRDEYTFSNTKLLSYIRNAKKLIPNVKFRPEDFKEDLLKSVCILIQDGTAFTYTHRSFQEYFTALFLTKFETQNHFDIYKKLAQHPFDHPIKLAFEINQSSVERQFVAPLVEEILLRTNNDARTLFKMLFKNITFKTIDARHRIITSMEDLTKSKKKQRALRWVAIQDARSDHGNGYSILVWTLMTLYEQNNKGKFPSLRHVVSQAKMKKALGEPQIGNLREQESKVIDWGLMEQTGFVERCEKTLVFLNWLDKEIKSRPFGGEKKDLFSIL